MDCRLLFLCVLYRTKPELSATLISLASIRPSVSKSNALVVWNNGAIGRLDDQQSIFCVLRAKFGVVDLIDDEINQPLGKIYNNIYKKYRHAADAFCILDDDSSIPDGYIDVFLAASSTCSVELYLPIVYHGPLLVSPIHQDGRRFHNLEPGVMPARQVNAIASGMIIPTTTLDKFRFNERFVFYGADSEYVRRISEHGGNVCVMATQIQHVLSTESSRRARLSDFKFSSLLQSFGLIGILYGERSMAIYKILRLSLRQSLFARRLLPIRLGIKMVLRVIRGSV